MLPNNFVGQSGLPQSQPQPGPQQGMPNMGMDQRMWLQQQQLAQQLRAQQQANGGQIPQQVGPTFSTLSLRVASVLLPCHHTTSKSSPSHPFRQSWNSHFMHDSLWMCPPPLHRELHCLNLTIEAFTHARLIMSSILPVSSSALSPFQLSDSR